MKTRNRFIYLMLVMSLWLAACGTLEVGVETPSTPAGGQTPSAQPTEVPATPAPTATSAPTIPADAVPYSNAEAASLCCCPPDGTSPAR